MLNQDSEWLIRIYPMSLRRAKFLDRFNKRAVTFSRNGKNYLEIRADDFNCSEEQKRRLLDMAYDLSKDFPDSIVKLRFYR